MKLISLRRSGWHVLKGSHSFTCHPRVYPCEWNEPSCLYSQPQSITALWPVLISRPTEGKKLSWPRCLFTYGGGMPGPKMVTHPSTNRPIVRRPGIELTTTESQVRRPDYSTTGHYVRFNSRFPGEPRFASSPSVFFLHFHPACTEGNTKH